MNTATQAIRGMNDILPAQIDHWQYIEQQWRALLKCYDYHEIRLPIVEKTELFQRSIGEATDIVEKEMYTFQDRNAESLTLRPEGTAGCVRAAIQHGLLYHQQQKLWYSGPMFRYERPQKGRYRQFHQAGVETFGYADYRIEVELLALTARLWQELELTSQLQLHINSLGTPDSRLHYQQAFVTFCQQHVQQLDEDSRRRLSTNPLRILDSKNPEMQDLLQKAPVITDYLDDSTRQQFDNLCAVLGELDIPFQINPRLVRGLDYYTGTVFEWVTQALGAQGAVCAGGRYDGLVAQLGGPATPAAGFAIGMERLIALFETMQDNDIVFLPVVDVYIVTVGAAAEVKGLLLAEALRDELPALRVIVNLLPGNFKTQFKRADKSRARYALILGEEEIRDNRITCKSLREHAEQHSWQFEDLVRYLRGTL